MTDIDIDNLTQDLRSRINPAYADTIGTESYERKQCVDALQEQRNNIVLFASELERLRCLLHDSRYTDSKDWRESNLAGRIEWLITMYESAKDEIERLRNELRSTETGRSEMSEGFGDSFFEALYKQGALPKVKRLQAELDALKSQYLFSNPVPSVPDWMRVIDEEMVCTHLGVADASDDYDTAKAKLSQLIQWHVAVATDPAVNGGYQLVPVEPTPSMVAAMEKQWMCGANIDMAKREYIAALAAAPKPGDQG